jgi:thiamine-monophosphate kinase
VAELARSGEQEALALLARLLPRPPAGEVWVGDDAAVLRVPCPGGEERFMLFAADALVAGVDADLGLTSLADFGWKALAVNLSDLGAMGAQPGHAVVSVVGTSVAELEQLYGGLLEASVRFGCPVVGGDLSSGATLVVSVAVTGWVEGPPVLRRGARPGDSIWVTAPLGAAAAGLRLLRSTGSANLDSDLLRAHARPEPALAEGRAARLAGATAMIDVSDGFLADLAHIAESSAVGFELSSVPVARGATREEALHGGDDYALIFTLPSGSDPRPVFSQAGLPLPHEVGTCTEEVGERSFLGHPVDDWGWQHQM